MTDNNQFHRWPKFLLKWLSRLPYPHNTIIDILRTAETNHLFPPEVLPMAEGILNLSDFQVHDIMVPKVQMVCVNRSDSPKKIISIALETGYSRFPVTNENNEDEIVGILLTKDLLAYFQEGGKANFNIKDVMRPVLFVPESKRLHTLLNEFKQNRNHMAVVINEYKGVAGLITIEDIIEEITGEIGDEHDYDQEEYNIRAYDKGRFMVNALTPIEEFNKYFNVNFSHDSYGTVGGLVMHVLGKRLPKRGELLEYQNFKIKVLKADKRKISTLRFTREKNKS